MIEKKQDILQIIKEKGPCIPSNISGQIKLSLLFTSALLSELVSDKALKLSYLKIGGSPLYFLPGQEEQLENFTKYLAGQEKDTLKILREKKVLNEEDLKPVQRVALRNMKDFSVAIKLKQDGKEKVFWRHFTFPEEEAKREIERLLKDSERKEEQEPKKEEIKPKEVIKPAKPEVTKPVEKKVEKPKEKKEEKLLHPKVKRKRKDKLGLFKEKVFDHLKSKKIDIFKNLDEGNKLCIALVDSEIGLLKYLVYGLNKKTINEADLSLASSEGQHEKLPVLIITIGRLTKKGTEYLKRLGNVVINKISV
ncbi:MAG: hypothetical protein JSW08_01125 [archaeon]|nr:MAG: hypothetical protein JSW08_01125 [archaeon]